MRTLKAHSTFAPFVLVACILGGCGTIFPDPVQRISQPIHPESSVLSIDVTKKFLGLSWKAYKIYFAKVDSEGSLLQQSIIRSNYTRDGRVYLLNARPGTYVAVAETRLTSGKRTTTYFAKELVEQTKVTIGTNDFVFMGRYIVDVSTWFRWSNADAVQTHYLKLTTPAFTIVDSLSGRTRRYTSHRGTLVQRINDEQSRNDAVRKAKEDLRGSGWAVRIK